MTHDEVEELLCNVDQRLAILEELLRPIDTITASELAMLFHDRYEQLAPSYGYETREETRTFDANSNNGRLMIAVCNDILLYLRRGSHE